jgi:hypothetical protein
MQVPGALVHADDHVSEHLVLATNKHPPPLLRARDAKRVGGALLVRQQGTLLALPDGAHAGLVGVELGVQHHGALGRRQQRRAHADHA